MAADEIVARARACLGARFRPWGRNPVLGLDCVGLAGHAFAKPAPAAYALRGGDPAAAALAIAATGLRPIDPATADAGALLLLSAGAGQLHLAVLTGRGFVHADARLRRIVETPGRPDMAVLGAWRED